MQNLTISIIQDEIAWQDPPANRSHFGEKIRELDKTNLIVLPEMFSTGFYMEPWQAYETMEGQSVQWMQQTANDTEAVVTGSLIMKIDDHFVNRMIWARPNDALTWYDKRHLFRFGGEHHHFTPGNERVILELNGWRILLQICYDLRFPVWSRNRGDYDMILYVANWPNARQYAWDTLVRARAIENQSYVAAVNTVGANPLGDSYSGGSAILDFMGQPLHACQNQISTATKELSMEKLQEFRKSFPAERDCDAFSIDVEKTQI